MNIKEKTTGKIVKPGSADYVTAARSLHDKGLITEDELIVLEQRAKKNWSERETITVTKETEHKDIMSWLGIRRID